MKDFLLHNYTVINKIVILIAALSGLFVLNKYKKTPIKYFIYFLFYVLITELISAYPLVLKEIGYYNLIENTRFKFNFWFRTLSWYLGSAIFFAWYYRKIIKNHFLKKTILYGIILFLTISIFSIVLDFNHFFDGTFSVIRIGNASIIVLCVMFYFYEILQSESMLRFYKSTNFYISSIIFVWLLITIPLVHFICGNSNSDPNQAVLKWMIMLYANMFMYLSFAIVLIFSNSKKN